MKQIVILLLIFSMALSFPILVSADCVDLGKFTRWIFESEHKIIFYMGVKPIARLEVQDCQIQPSSSIRLIKSYVCDSDEIVIDGNTCNIMSLEILD